MPMVTSSHVDARQTRRLFVAADGVDKATEAGVIENHVADSVDDQHDDGGDGNDVEDLALADEAKAFVQAVDGNAVRR